MKRAILTFLMFCLVAVPTFAQSNGGALEFETKSQDYGIIKIKEGPQVRQFTFTNTGDAPVVITHADVSCKCTTVKFPRKPTMPGETTIVEVTYTPNNEIGRFNNKIVLHTNAEQRRHTLTVTGETVKK